MEHIVEFYFYDTITIQLSNLIFGGKGGIDMSAPLADRLRPQTLDDVVGQRHLLAEGKALRRIIDSGQIPNMVFYGPSGVGKNNACYHDCQDHQP